MTRPDINELLATLGDTNGIAQSRPSLEPLPTIVPKNSQSWHPCFSVSFLASSKSKATCFGW